MMTTTIAETLLFEEQVQLTRIIDYGYSWEDFTKGTREIPSEGLRFDIEFEGHVTGEQIAGIIRGVDYLTVRADGRLFLNLQATIITGDGARIAVSETGINHLGELQLSMNFHTSHPSYRWVNQVHVRGIGRVDFKTGQVTIQGFKSSNQ